MIGGNKGIEGHLSFVLEGSVQVLLAWGAGSWHPIGMNPHLELANTLLCYQGYTHNKLIVRHRSIKFSLKTDTPVKSMTSS